MANTNKKIYVIDDDEIFHFIIKKMFGLQGWGDVSISSFLCAEEAIEELNAYTETTLPSLIILDMNMQRMNGWDFIDAFRELKSKLSKEVPIIMCSSSTNLADMEKVKKTPELMAYITKPLDKSKMSMIAKYL
ncbi:response regulator receiver domain-containing protein [Chitinophaga skermanii]|uniref:Response regulator receiver domain-containing protein n=1 Tax=Chitinophaga skermanii TaxID=331697 RepID=A0A327QLA9_9BACT|nr:response regulator [Chitinophaga skermanii]RAJ02537.1 response regulator receiver domain-containing protein [Chitinophaga skermanii]